MEEKENSSKKRILWLVRYLFENTDADHMVTTQDIERSLNEANFHVSRKTIKSDMEDIADVFPQLKSQKSHEVFYYISNRLLELPEIKILADIVAASHIISQEVSRKLIEKLCHMANKYHYKDFANEIMLVNRVKTVNENVIEMTKKISEANRLNKKVGFQYMFYDINKNRKYMNEGSIYKCSPYALQMEEDFYYLAGYSDRLGRTVTFRVDRMDNVFITEEESVPVPEGVNIEDYANKVFEMFDGEEKEVTLLCNKNLMKNIIDRFGEDVDTEPISEEQFLAHVKVSVSGTFFGWVFRFGTQMSIVGPDEVNHQFRELLANVLELNEQSNKFFDLINA